MKVDLQWPPIMLSPNTQAHWGTKARAKAKYRRDVAMEVICQTRPIDRVNASHAEKLHVHLAFHPKVRRKRDMDNLVARMKSGLDGIADALHVDDHKFVLTHEITEERTGTVRVTLKHS